MKEGRRVRAASQPASSGAGAVAKNVAKAAGTFALGSVLSLAGALIGGAVWYVVARYLNAEVGYIAWGIGVLAGAGMHIGHRQAGSKAGVVAAGMAAVGILAAKAAIFFFLLFAVITGNTDDIDLQRQFVINHIAQETLDGRGVEPGTETDEQWDAAWDEAEQRIGRMTDQEVRAKWQEYRDLADEPAEEPADDETGSAPEVEPGDDAAVEDAARGLAVLFVQTQFGLFDILWFLLAIGSAFKIAGRGISFSGED